MIIFAIDPGPVQSAWVKLRQFDWERLPEVIEYGIQPNCEIALCGPVVVIEKIVGYGMIVGAEVFETAYESGKFAQRARNMMNWNVYRISRKDVKLQLCQDTRAKDANIRQALIDRWGGKAAIKKGGPLYGVSSHVWAALAVGVTWIDLRKTLVPEE